jgi:hypothetical protein
MNQQEAVKWAYRQDVVKVSCIKDGEDDKFILTVGQYSVTPIVFDTQEQAQTFLDTKLKLTNFDLSVIGAMYQRLNEIYEQQLVSGEQ